MTRKTRAPAIVTNPPFSLADAFIEHALSILGVEYLALLLPLNFYSAKGRIESFRIYKPTQILPHTWRIDSTGGGSPTMNSQWVLWEAGKPPIRGYNPLSTDERQPGVIDPLE